MERKRLHKMYTDDPIADFMAHDAEQQAEMEKLPLCSICESPITSAFALHMYNEWICDECIEDMKEEVLPHD